MFTNATLCLVMLHHVWLKKCKKAELHEDKTFKSSEIKGIQLDKFFDTLYKYLTHKSFLNELVEDFSDLFDIQEDMANNIIVRNYLLWIVGEKVYYLKNKETNSTPSDPIKIPHELRFNDFILNIWEKQLPEIYAENYTKRKSNVGKDILEKVVFS